MRGALKLLIVIDLWSLKIKITASQCVLVTAEWLLEAFGPDGGAVCFLQRYGGLAGPRGFAPEPLPSGFNVSPYPSGLFVFPLLFSYVVYGDIRRGQLHGGGEDCIAVSRVCSLPDCGTGSVSGGQVSHNFFTYFEVGETARSINYTVHAPSRPCRQKSVPRIRSIGVRMYAGKRERVGVARR